MEELDSFGLIMCFLRHVARPVTDPPTNCATKLCHPRQLGTRLRSDEPKLPEGCPERYQVHLDANDEQMTSERSLF
jgi:hypothetical protein